MKKQKPAKARITRTKISVTLEPVILAMIDRRSHGRSRSEQINADLARYYTLTAGKTEISHREFLKLKAIAIENFLESVVVGENDGADSHE